MTTNRFNLTITKTGLGNGGAFISYRNNEDKPTSAKLLDILFDSEANNYADKINIIDHLNISILNESFNSVTSSIFTDSFAEMYYNFVLVRKILNNNIVFLKQLVAILAKIVHPNIQLFYGILLDKDTKQEIVSNCYNNNDCIGEGSENEEEPTNLILVSTISNKGNLTNRNKNMSKIKSKNEKKININTIISSIGLILEYVNGVDLKSYKLLNLLMTEKESLYIKLTIIKKISETMAFLHKSGFPHLLLNGKNVKINYKLLEDKNKQIYSGCGYSESNLLKIIELGSFYKYSNSMQFTSETEKFYELSFHSPYLLHFFDNIKNTDLVSHVTQYKKNDFWSFGCLVYELFTGNHPFFDYENKENLKDFVVEEFFNNDNEESIHSNSIYDNSNNNNNSLMNRELKKNNTFNVNEQNIKMNYQVKISSRNRNANTNLQFPSQIPSNSMISESGILRHTQTNITKTNINSTINNENHKSDFFIDYHKESIQNIEEYLVNISKNEKAARRLYNKLFNLISLSTFGNKKEMSSNNTGITGGVISGNNDNKSSKINKIVKFEDISELIYELFKEFEDMFKEDEVENLDSTESKEITEVIELPKPDKYRSYTNFNLTTYMEIVELDELIKKNATLTEELNKKKILNDEKESELKRVSKRIEEMNTVKKFAQTITSNTFINYMYFISKKSKEFIFVGDKLWNKSLALNVLDSKEVSFKNSSNLKTVTMNLSLCLNKNLKIKNNNNNNDAALFTSIEDLITSYLKNRNVTVALEDINNILDAQILFESSSCYYSSVKQRLYISGGKLVYYPKENEKHRYVFETDNKEIKPKLKRNRKINVLLAFAGQNYQNINLSNVKEIEIIDKINDLEQRKQFYIGELGNTLVRRSKHSMIEIDDYLFIIGGEQDNKCEVLDISTNNSFFIEDLNAVHINPILFWSENSLYSINFEGLMKKFREVFRSNLDNNNEGNNSGNLKYASQMNFKKGGKSVFIHNSTSGHQGHSTNMSSFDVNSSYGRHNHFNKYDDNEDNNNFDLNSYNSHNTDTNSNEIDSSNNINLSERNTSNIDTLSKIKNEIKLNNHNNRIELDTKSLKNNINRYRSTKINQDLKLKSVDLSDKFKQRNSISVSNESLFNNNLFVENEQEEIVVMESLDTTDLSSNPKWKICKVNCDALMLIEPVQFTYFQSILLFDEIIIFGSESISSLENTWLYYIKFNIKNRIFSASKPVPPNNKFNIFKYSLLVKSNIINDLTSFYFFNVVNQKMEKLDFKDINL